MFDVCHGLGVWVLYFLILSTEAVALKLLFDVKYNIEGDLVINMKGQVIGVEKLRKLRDGEAPKYNQHFKSVNFK